MAASAPRQGVDVSTDDYTSRTETLRVESFQTHDLDECFEELLNELIAPGDSDRDEFVDELLDTLDEVTPVPDSLQWNERDVAEFLTEAERERLEAYVADLVPAASPLPPRGRQIWRDGRYPHLTRPSTGAAHSANEILDEARSSKDRRSLYCLRTERGLPSDRVLRRFDLYGHDDLGPGDRVCAHEVIDGARPFRPVFDIDAKTAPPEEHDAIKAAVVDSIAAAIANVGQIAYVDVLAGLVAMTSSDSNALSLHFVYRLKHLRNADEAKRLTELVSGYLGEYAKYLDAGLPKSLFSLRLLGSTKIGTMRKKVLTRAASKQGITTYAQTMVQPRDVGYDDDNALFLSPRSRTRLRHAPGPCPRASRPS